MKTIRLLPTVCLLFLTLLQQPTAAQEPNTIAYHLSWQQPNSHFFDVQITVDKAAGKTVAFRIPAWRPGRYDIQNFAKNIIDFSAIDENGKALSFSKVDKGTWNVDVGKAKKIIAQYRCYARQLDAGASYLDDAEASINPVTVLMYLPGKELLPVSLAITKPADWRIATSLDFDPQTGVFRSENYHELVDAPILISPDFKKLSFEEGGAIFEMVFQGKADFDSVKVIADVKKIVAAEIDIMRRVPFKRYVFLYHLFPYRFGHGVEHKNSTSIATGPVDFANEGFYRGFLSITAHEFFHAWNVERIRDVGIYYPDYSTEQYTTTMWIYEGITSYYGGLAQERAQFNKPEKYYGNLAGAIANYKTAYGRRLTSPAMASFDSWTKGYSDAPPHTYFSFYSSGSLLGLIFDLEVRQRTQNQKSLDEVMQYLDQTYAQKNRGVPEDGLQKALEKIAGGSFEQLFADYVYGTKEIDFDTYLGNAGLELQKNTNDKLPEAYLGIATSGDDKQTTISSVAPESPAFNAGLDLDDILLAIDNQRATKDNLTARLMPYAPGDTVVVSVFRRDELRQFPVVLGGDGNVKYEIKEIKEPTDLQLKIRQGWLRLPEEDKNLN